MIVKLKHVHLVSSDAPALDIFNELTGFREWGLLTKLLKFNKVARQVAEDLAAIEVATVTPLDSSGRLTLPENIDMISFGARVEINGLMSGLSDENFADHVSSILAMACFQGRYHEPYKEGMKFTSLKYYVLDLPIMDARGMLESLVSKINGSNELWGNRFSEVAITDPDFGASGGAMLDKFSTLSIVEFACSNFNLAKDEVWQTSFSIIQMALWKQRSEDFIRDRMATLKEQRMKRKNKQ